MNWVRSIYLLLASLSALVAVASLSTTASFAENNKLTKPSPAQSRDLQGMWTGGTLTPIERPPELAGKTHFAPSELEEQQRRSTQRFWEAGHRDGDVGRDNDAFLDNDLKILASGQTSLVVEPSDGRVPLLPEAEQRRDFNLNNFDSYERMSQWDRCITRLPTVMIPAVYNNAYQIVQTPTQIVIVSEMIHDARIIPIDGSPHVDARIRSWSGDSRGHWEGNTLVVDTTNFNDRGWIATSGNTGRIRGVPFSADLHIVERFTRIDAQTLAYELTIDDPRYYRQAWKISYPLQHEKDYRMFEYACHEDNYAIESILRGARVQEQAQVEKK
jgi:hypothetical protein